jgi:hypothetical protein
MTPSYLTFVRSGVSTKPGQVHLGVPGVIAVARFKIEPVTMMIGGERKTIVIESEPAYNALYEIENPPVLSDAWAKGVEAGRWAEHVRPYTTNRRHVMYRRISQLLSGAN